MYNDGMKKDSIIGKYSTLPFSEFRLLIADALHLALSKPYIKALVEFDVTDSRKLLREHRRLNGKGLSLTAWFIKCIARAVSEFPQLNAMRKKNKIIVFDDIDISVAIEMDMDDEKVPRLYVVRRAQDKSAQDIFDEIVSAQAQNKESGDVELGEKENVRLVRFNLWFPEFIRKRIWKKFLRDPFFVKRMMGTIGITAVGMFGSLAGWPVPIPTSNHPLSFALGGITSKPLAVKGRVEIREVLSVTIFYDHDIIDGAPAARFTHRLKRLVEEGFGLSQNSG